MGKDEIDIDKNNSKEITKLVIDTFLNIVEPSGTI